MLYRVFPFDPAADPTDDGGALFVPRARQGAGRHDNPDHYGALYASRHAESAIAERLQAFRGMELREADLVRADGRRYALISLDDAALEPTVDLDDPAELVRLAVRPSRVATHERSLTQPLALRLFHQGATGFGWWSTLEASWANVTLFAERAVPGLELSGAPEVLSADHLLVRQVAAGIGVRLTR